jgi:phosphoesterase RecJ-like protein
VVLPSLQTEKEKELSMPEPLVVLDWEAAAQAIQAAQKIIVVTHINPDGDAIGSLCGLGLALREHGKEVTLAVDGGITPYLSYVPGSETVQATLENLTADLVISVDASDLGRAGAMGATAWTLDVPKLVVDHHVTNTLFGTLHVLHSDFVSTTEAVLRLIDFLGWELSLPIAKALMVGFITDTISFRVGPVTAETLEQVGRLMRLGVTIKEVVERMLERAEPGQLTLLGRGLLAMQVEEHVAWTSLRLQDFQEAGLALIDKPELSTEMLRDPRVYISAFFLETEGGDVRVSIRATPGFDVGSLAAGVGGGGHTLAAGIRLRQTTVEAAGELLIPLLKVEAKRGKALYRP